MTVLKEPIAIQSIASISPLGMSLDASWKAYQDKRHFITTAKIGDTSQWVARLPELARNEIAILRASDTKYLNLDASVLYAIFVSRKAIVEAGWQANKNIGVNFGSSRGATTLFEKYHSEFLQNNKSTVLSSPTTTLGNISSWVAHDLQTKGPELSHSITCSTALHSLLNGVAWLQSGMAKKFLVGGSEAPITPFTLAQMHAMKIYSKSKINLNTSVEYPCQALNLQKKKNTMVLGEAASVACLEKEVSSKTLALISGVGYATEILEHNVSISTDALCFQKSMQMALGTKSPKEVDAIVMHAPGTIKGDMSEFKAIQNIFGHKIPALTSNKWKVGHTFGASGMLSIELAVLMLQHQEFIGVPFENVSTMPKQLKTILVNAVGFGGNAVTVLLSTPS